MKKMPSNARMDRKGSAAGLDHVKAGFRALCEEARFKKPKAMSFGHEQNMAKYKAKGLEDIEARFVLVDYLNGNEQIKAKNMTHLEAWKRNQVLAGTGLAWAKCGI